MTYCKQTDSIWGCTDAQSQFVRKCQMSGMDHRNITEIILSFRNLNEINSTKGNQTHV